MDEIKANTGPSALPPPPRPSRACRPPGLHGNSLSKLLGRPFAVTRRKSFLSSGRWKTKDVGNWRKGPTWLPPDSCPLPPAYAPEGLGRQCGQEYWILGYESFYPLPGIDTTCTRTRSRVYFHAVLSLCALETGCPYSLETTCNHILCCWVLFVVFPLHFFCKPGQFGVSGSSLSIDTYYQSPFLHLC